MSDVIGRGVIEVYADASKLKTGMSHAKRFIRDLGNASTEASEKASKSIDRYINKLQQKNLKLGMSSRELALYKRTLHGTTDAQLKAADVAIKMQQVYAKDVDWSVSASVTAAMQNYLDSANNIAQLSQDAFTKAFHGMEDGMMQFISTGKANFGDLAKSIIADIIKIQIKMVMMKAIQSIGGLMGGVFDGAGAIKRSDNSAVQSAKLAHDLAQIKPASDVVVNGDANLADEREYASVKLPSFDLAESDWVVGANEAMQNYLDNASTTAKLSQNVFSNAFQGMDDAFANFVTNGKLSFSDLAKSVIADIAKMQARAAISGLFNFAIGIIGAYFGSAAGGGEASASNTQADWSSKVGGGQGLKFNALGAVYDVPSLSTYANAIVSTPSTFALAQKTGMMGEAGPEAIMPLKRAADGALGVRAMGSSSGATINLQTHVYVRDGHATSETTGDSAGRQLADIINQQLKQVLLKETRQGGILWNPQAA